MDIDKKVKEILDDVDEMAERTYQPDTMYIRRGVWELGEYAKKIEEQLEKQLKKEKRDD